MIAVASPDFASVASSLATFSALSALAFVALLAIVAMMALASAARQDAIMAVFVATCAGRAPESAPLTAMSAASRFMTRQEDASQAPTPPQALPVFRQTTIRPDAMDPRITIVRVAKDGRPYAVRGGRVVTWGKKHQDPATLLVG